MQILYRTAATASGGRAGSVRSDDGALDLILDRPEALGGHGGPGTNPEQLFAAGYAACFLSSLKFVAAQKNLKIDDDAQVTAQVAIAKRDDAKGFELDVALEIFLPGQRHDEADQLVKLADQVCPFSYLAHNDTDVRLSVVELQAL